MVSLDPKLQEYNPYSNTRVGEVPAFGSLTVHGGRQVPEAEPAVDASSWLFDGEINTIAGTGTYSSAPVGTSFDSNKWILNPNYRDN